MAESLQQVKTIKAATIEHGHIHESVALNCNDQNKEVFKCGLVVSLEHPFVACSPDGIVNNNLIVEVKCPYTARNREITPSTVPYLKQDHEGKLALDENHDYFYQIQGQLMCTGAKHCDFVVCAADKLTVHDRKYISIAKNDAFIKIHDGEINYIFQLFISSPLS